MKTAIVTGCSGFIGYHISMKLIDNGYKVFGIDNLSDYYDVNLKLERQKRLLRMGNFEVVNENIENPGEVKRLFDKSNPEVVIHLAAQAGVRYSIDNPRAYLESNVIGTFELLEAAREFKPKHLLLASTSSAYGANVSMPYSEMQKTDHQMSFYAATKKSNEVMAHSYAHIYGIPITLFRFFTVYGPWGRPDMALFKFTKSILNGVPIDVYNNGDMRRDFTYIDDLIDGIYGLIGAIPSVDSITSGDSISPVAPWRIVNIGNSNPVNLLDFISAIERSTGRFAIKNLLPMQAGDVPSTWADVSLIKSLTGYDPKTNVDSGVDRFVNWYRSYYNV